MASYATGPIFKVGALTKPYDPDLEFVRLFMFAERDKRLTNLRAITDILHRDEAAALREWLDAQFPQVAGDNHGG